MLEANSFLVVPRDEEHDARPNRDGSELHECLAKLSHLVRARLEQLRDHGHCADVEKGSRGEGEEPGELTASESVARFFPSRKSNCSASDCSPTLHRRRESTGSCRGAVVGGRQDQLQ